MELSLCGWLARWKAKKKAINMRIWRGETELQKVYVSSPTPSGYYWRYVGVVWNEEEKGESSMGQNRLLDKRIYNKQKILIISTLSAHT